MAEPLRNIVDAGWVEALEPVADRIAAMGEFPGRDCRRAPVPASLARTCRWSSTVQAAAFAIVRVLIVGQDPYPRPGIRSA